MAQARPNGSISGAVTDAAWSRGHAQFSATYADCGLDGGQGCFWSAAAYVIAPDDNCRRSDPFAIPAPTWLAWASDGQRSNAVVKGEVDFFMRGTSGQRLCLYVYDRVTKSYWVGTSEFTIGVLPPPPAPTVATVAPPAVALTVAAAKTSATKALAARYAQAWRRGKARKLTCSPPRAGRVQCSVRFRFGKLRYAGVVIVTGDPAHATTTLRVKKRR